MKKLLALLILTSAAFASATMTYPREIAMDYGSYNDQNVYYLGEFDLGNVAPGQTLELVFSRNTGPGNTESDASIFWEKAEGTGVTSSLDGLDLGVKHVIPASARGYYAFDLTLEGSEVGTIAPHRMTIKTYVTEDVYSFEYERIHVMSAGTTKDVIVKITSSSAASETITFQSADGIPSGWVKQDDVRMGPLETKTITMKVTPNEEGLYDAKIKAGRASSSVQDVLPITVRVKPTLNSKLKAFGEGFSIIPVVMQPFYSLLSLLGAIA